MSSIDEGKKQSSQARRLTTREKYTQSALNVVFDSYQDKCEQEINSRVAAGLFSKEILKEKTIAGQSLDEVEIMFTIWAIDSFTKRKRRRGNKFTHDLSAIGEEMYRTIAEGNTIESALRIVSTNNNLSVTHLRKIWTGIKGINPHHNEIMAGIRNDSRKLRRQTAN